jgi:NADPH-dependent 7-cyano-7-deazaguanine reductase QueF
VEVSWRVAEMTVELHALAAYLASWADQRISHEEVTEQIVRDLEALDGIEDVSAYTRWQTAGMAVTVDRS